jgi:hypothetical protein
MSVQDSLINLIIERYIELKDVSYEVAFEKVYASNFLETIKDTKTTYPTWAVDDLIELIDKR